MMHCSSGSQRCIAHADIRAPPRWIPRATPVKTAGRTSQRASSGQHLQHVGGKRCTIKASAAAPAQTQGSPVASPGPGQVTMRTKQDCALAVSIYPRFSYDARGGGGTAQATPVSGSQRLQLGFDIDTLSIPDVSYDTARILGLPLPPIFRIAIQPLSLQGTVDRGTGKVELQFEARFNFTASVLGRTLYSAPPLLVTTALTTASAQGAQLAGQGSLMRDSGEATLVGVSLVPRTGDFLLDTFLRLPSDTLAVLSAQFEFGPSL
mmetsp:Transcript_13040/g.39505  ORF Transcript_13040/g.39505 Transcript_13040/m.39505 type:complete len:264 (+) Transcript_13040:221-1012(+)